MRKFTGYTLDGGYAEYAVADAAILFSDSRFLQRRGSRTAALRRTDRLSQFGQSRQRQTAWASTVSAPPPISLPKWQNINSAKSTPSAGRAMMQPNDSL